MTLCAFGANTGQKKAKYGGHFEIQNGRRRHTRKKWKQLRFCSKGYLEGKKHWFH